MIKQLDVTRKISNLIMKKSQYTRLASIVATSVLTLTACGGGDSSDAPTKPPVIGQNGAVDVRGVTMSEDQTCGVGNFAPAMLAAVNQARSQARACGGQQFAAAPALGWNWLLTLAATNHAGDMAVSGKLSEVGSNGSTLTDRINVTGYEYVAVGENLAKGYATIPQLMNALLSSPDHCKKIMNPSITEVGAACSKSAAETNYWTQTFGVHKSFN